MNRLEWRYAKTSEPRLLAVTDDGDELYLGSMYRSISAYGWVFGMQVAGLARAPVVTRISERKAAMRYIETLAHMEKWEDESWSTER